MSSTIATVALEDVARTGVPRWFQLYVLKDRGFTEDLIRRAHGAGYGALVLTADTPILGQAREVLVALHDLLREPLLLGHRGRGLPASKGRNALP